MATSMATLRLALVAVWVIGRPSGFASGWPLDARTPRCPAAPQLSGEGLMILFWTGLIVACVTAVAVTVMLLVRRRAPEGSYFEDGDRAAGVFGVLATGFAVLLGFVVFLAFESYDTSRSGAEAEAQIVAQQFETAQFFPIAARAPLSGYLMCYARTVVHQEWPRMRSGTLGDTLNPWGVATFRTLTTVEPRS